MKTGYMTFLVFVVILGLGVGASFAAGSGWGKNDGKFPWQTTPTPLPVTSGAALSSGQGNVQQSGGTGGFGGAGGRPAATGTVDSISGNTITVKTNSGTVKVTASDNTPVRRTVDGKVSDIQAGQEVVVVGSQNADGSVAASSIQIVPAPSSTPVPGSSPSAGGSRTPGANPTRGSQSGQGQ